MNEQDLGRYPDERYRREVDVGVETELAKQAGVDDQRAADHQDGVAVAGGFRDQRGSDIAARSRVVLDIERLTEDLGQLGRKQAGNHIDWPARRKRRNQSDRPLRIGGLRVGGACEDAGRQGHGNPQPQTCHSNLTGPAQSARIFASRTTLPHFSISVFRRWSNSCGVFATGTKPRLSSRSLTSGMATICTMFLCQRSMISLGVPAGATMPVSVSLSRSGTPASTLVGTSGKDGERRVLSTAMPCSLPSFMLLIAGGSAVNAIGVWPPMVELTAKPAPLNGTVTRSSPYFLLEQLAGEVWRRAGRRLRKAVGSRVFFDQLDQLLECFGGKARVGRDDVGRRGNERNGRKSLERIVGDLRVHARIDDEARAHDKYGVAVRLRFCGVGNSGIPAGPRKILDINLLAPGIGQFLRNDTRNHIGRPRRRKRHDQPDRMRRISLGQ